MDYLVMNFGAKGDGRSDDTGAIQSAIDRCFENGGGRVILESGHTYVCRTLELKSHVEFHICNGAVLKASSYFAEYYEEELARAGRNLTEDDFPYEERPFHALLSAKKGEHITISGMGSIDGNESMYYKQVKRYHISGAKYPRIHLVMAVGCNQFTVKDVTLKSSGCWTLHPVGCNDVLIQNIRILNNLKMENCDGIDPDHCKNVRILGCHISCGDDCIVIKNTREYREYGDTENIVISGCTLSATSAAIKIGTEGVNDFRNILIESCTITRSNRGISLQIRDGGNVERMICQNLLIDTRRFSDDWWGTAEPICITSIDRCQGNTSGTISGCLFSNILCEGENGIFLYTPVRGRIRDISLRNVGITLKKTSKWPVIGHDIRPSDGGGWIYKKVEGFYCENVENCTGKDIRIRVDESMKEVAYWEEL